MCRSLPRQMELFEELIELLHGDFSLRSTPPFALRPSPRLTQQSCHTARSEQPRPSHKREHRRRHLPGPRARRTTQAGSRRIPRVCEASDVGIRVDGRVHHVDRDASLARTDTPGRIPSVPSAGRSQHWRRPATRRPSAAVRLCCRMLRLATAGHSPSSHRRKPPMRGVQPSTRTLDEGRPVSTDTASDLNPPGMG